MDKSKGMIGPFRATRMWNEIVSDFRSGIPTKRHRWKMRFYDDCFMSNEAVDWLHNYLQTNENYGPWVTREQAIQLLEKFAQSKIIESVKPFKGGSKEPFEDNGSLYKLVHLSPMKKLRSALHGKNNLRSLTPSPKKSRTRGPMRPLSLNSKLMNAVEEENWNIKSKLLSGNREKKTDEKVIGPSQRRRLSKPGVLKRSRSLGGMDKQTSSSSVASVSSVKGHGQDESRARSQKTEAVWKTAALARLKRLLWLFTLEGVVDETTIKGKSIIHNSTQLSRSGVVVISDKTDDLPHWVLSAMKCIANWPQNQDSELPSYDGFEKDVFHTISNYFQSLQEPLMTFNLYNLINQAYGLQLEANKSYCEEAMRLALLLLPPPNRRKLHLLFKMMSKVERNEELQLYPQESKRDLLLHTFTRCILRTESEVDFDEAYANRIVSYLLDNFNTILAPSAALTADVSERLNLEQGSQYNAKAGSSVVYCKQITKEEYQNDIQTTSQKAMSDLLETIIADKNMEVKEKKKRLKVFQKAYPEIYKTRLPTAASEAELFPTKPKIKQPMLKRSFTRLKPIR